MLKQIALPQLQHIITEGQLKIYFGKYLLSEHSVKASSEGRVNHLVSEHRSIQTLSEARDSSLNYIFKKTGKMITKVILELTGNESGRMTRIAKRYAQLDRMFKLLETRRNDLNAEVKHMIEEEYFDPADAALTRVIETCSLTVTLTKAETADMKKSTYKTDYEAIVKELELMVPELTDKLKELSEKYTEEVPPKDTPAKLLVKAKLEEGLFSGVKRFIAYFKNWAKSYDKKLEHIKSMM